MSSTGDQIESNGYAVLHSVIDSAQADALQSYCLRFAGSKRARPDEKVGGAWAEYGNPFMEGLLDHLLPTVEEAVNRQLYPTYSYFRVYQHGSVLHRHRDRPSCEISMSLCIGYRAEAAWPLFIEGPKGVFAAALEPGDALLYKGIECPHWREPFTGESASQVFLHYVDKDGPHAEWKLDKRSEAERLVIPLTHLGAMT